MNWISKLVRVNCCLFVISLSVPTLAISSEGDRPNILWIIADDLGLELGCYGYEGVATPNIDRLADDGVRFVRAFSTSPVCSAARTAMITGMFQTSIGGFHHRTRKLKPLPSPVMPVTEYFRKAGYFVSNGSGEALNKKISKSDFNFEYEPAKLFDGADWSQRVDGQPFFAQVQIKQPHRPFVKSGKSGEGLKIPPFYPDHPVTRADWANYLASIELLDQKVGAVLDRLKKEGLADNTIVFFFGDHGAPHVRGKQWLYDEGISIPLIIRWPGALRPGKVVGMVSMIDFVPTVLAMAGIDRPDHLHGTELFSESGELKFHPNQIFAARDRCGDAVDRIRCYRTLQWKYIRNYFPERSFSQMSGYKKLQYPVLTLMAVMNEQGRLEGRQAEWFAESRPAEELYDLENDPDELINLAGDPAQAEKLAEMSAILDEWILQTGDQGADLEGDGAYMKDLMAGKRAYYEKSMKRRKLDPHLSNRAYLNWWKKELGLPLTKK